MIDAVHKQFIEDEVLSCKDKLKREGLSKSEKLEVYQTIISLKRMLIDLGQNHSLYNDYKNFILLYLEAKEEKDFQYDDINLKILVSKLQGIDPERKLKLLNYLNSKLKITGHDYLCESCKEYIHECELNVPFDKKSVKAWMKYILLLSSVSLKHILISLLLLYVIFVIILLPAPLPFMELFKVQYKDFSNYFIVNHLFNVLRLLFDFEKSMEVMPINWIGVILAILGKVIFITLIAHFLVKKLTAKTKFLD